MKKRIINLGLVIISILGVFVLTNNKDHSQISNDLNLEESSEVFEEEIKKSPLGITRLSAFGPANKKTLTVTIEPSFAPVGTLTWTSDKSQVVVTKIGDGRTAEVYATTYLPKDQYATITVTESLSGLSGTGKVYAWQKAEVVNSPISPNYWAINVDSLASTHKQIPASGTEFSLITVPFTTTYQMAVLNIAYKGSYAPVIKYKALHMGGQITTTTANTGRYASSAGASYTIASYNIYIYKGDPSLGYQTIRYEIYNPKTQEGPDSTWTNDTLLFTALIKTQ